MVTPCAPQPADGRSWLGIARDWGLVGLLVGGLAAPVMAQPNDPNRAMTRDSGTVLEGSLGPEAVSPSVGIRRGMNTQQVESKFGRPERRIGPVGDPPISRWIYPEFTVYFEDNLTLHAVTHHRRVQRSPRRPD